jgi:hypothetical protein
MTAAAAEQNLFIDGHSSKTGSGANYSSVEVILVIIVVNQRYGSGMAAILLVESVVYR